MKNAAVVISWPEPSGSMRSIRQAEGERSQPETNPFNQEYIDRLRIGEPETQKHFTRYFGRLLRIKARGRMRCPHLVEEVCQETLLRVLTLVRRGGVDRPERLAALVNSICNHVLLETFRRENRACPIPDNFPEPVDGAVAPDCTLMVQEGQRQVRRVLDGLPEKDRELLRQLFLEERDRDEVCRTFQVDREYLRVMLYRAKTRFRDSFEGAAEGASGSSVGRCKMA